MARRLDRRRMLGLGAATVSLALAGCGTPGGGEGDEGGEGGEGGEGDEGGEEGSVDAAVSEA